jgi:hypothetical protein
VLSGEVYCNGIFFFNKLPLHLGACRKVEKFKTTEPKPINHMGKLIAMPLSTCIT